MRSKNGGDGGTGVYMREGTTSRVTAADRTYGKCYDFYSVSPENFGSTQVLQPKQHVSWRSTYSRSVKNNAWKIDSLEVMNFVYLHSTYLSVWL